MLDIQYFFKYPGANLIVDQFNKYEVIVYYIELLLLLDDY